MRVVAQRVSSASVWVGDEVVGSIGHGLTLLVGITDDDGEEQIDYLVRKISNLRIFADAEGKMNRSVIEEQGSLLLVSQFTLYADVRKGRRPSFVRAADAAHARPLFDRLVHEFKKLNLNVETGEFGAVMAVELVNDGPVTIWFDTADLL